MYWLDCSTLEHADLVGAGVLSAAETVATAVVIGMGRSPQPMLDRLDPAQGPVRTKVYQVPRADLQTAFTALQPDLARATGRHPALCVVQLPAALLDALDEAALARWCQRLKQWALTHGSTVLLLSHGDAATLAPRLVPLNRYCAGVAQLHPHRGALQYLVHYWANTLGVVAHREFRVEMAGNQLHCVAAEDAVAQTGLVHEGNDRFLYLAHAAVLEGAPPFSPAWRLYDSWSTLVAPALQAQAASVLFGISENAQVDDLARALYRLRGERGNALKLVVREMAPCLRYADERLLLECGANLIVPPSTLLPRFLTLLETVQGQRWQGVLPDDPARLIRAHRPPDVGGIVSAMQFRQIVGALLAAEDQRVESALLVLQPVAGLRPEQALRQCTIRRRGDLACTYRGQVRLFLFACRSDGIERALGNLFRLPWQEMFDGYQNLPEYDVAAMNATEIDPDSEYDMSQGDPSVPSDPAPPTAPATAPLLPRTTRLGGGA
jgi:cellulose biosynthesis protein BcsE